ncbi:unnamed protein product [Ostreobium quekettii]|uniref:Uncharacterized protein n=1 Tax=Ostreobium quekettii TaxID=121088 RepID=A0A8S1J574_9CHLO|nr:unnamed protein product [Ostreobium quekettii]
MKPYEKRRHSVLEFITARLRAVPSVPFQRFEQKHGVFFAIDKSNTSAASVMIPTGQAMDVSPRCYINLCTHPCLEECCKSATPAGALTHGNNCKNIRWAWHEKSKHFLNYENVPLVNGFRLSPRNSPDNNTTFKTITRKIATSAHELVNVQ